MTDTEILEEFYKIQEYERLQRELRKQTEHHCNDCAYIGDPVPSSNICPGCSAEMTPPLNGADQTTWTDDDQVSSLQDIGIDLSKKDQELVRN